MKKIISILLTAIFAVSLSLSSYATEIYEKTLFIDDAFLVEDTEEEIINQKLQELSEVYRLDMAILTVNSTDGQDITAFADDYFDHNGFGYGKYADGIMLVVDMENREYAITTHGKAIRIFTDTKLYYLENRFIPYLSEGKYESAFITFYEGCVSAIDDYNLFYDNSYNDNYITVDEYSYEDYYKTTEEKLLSAFSLNSIVFAVIFGILIAFIVIYILKNQLKSVRPQPTAKNYIVPGSFSLTRQHDIFLYRNVKRIPKPKNNGSSGGRTGMGGSSTHVSSSGRTHGGSRGRF